MHTIRVGQLEDGARRNAREWIERHRLSGRPGRWRALLLPTRLLVGLALLATAGELRAQRVEVDAGVGNYVDVVGVGIGTDDWKRWSIGGNWSISLYAMGWV